MRFSTAIGVSVALHAVLAAGIAAYISCAPAPTTSVTLDLSSVELSFAETEDAAADVSPSAPMPTPEEAPRPKEEKPPQPELEKPDIPLPPEPESPRIPEPEQERVKMETPPPPVQAAAPRQAKLDAPPSPRKKIRPEYPESSRRRGEQGEVLVEMRIDAKGLVEQARIVQSSGFPKLDEAALRAVKSAQFNPAKSQGDSVASTARLKLQFEIR